MNPLALEEGGALREGQGQLSRDGCQSGNGLAILLLILEAPEYWASRCLRCFVGCGDRNEGARCAQAPKADTEGVLETENREERGGNNTEQW